MTKTIMIPPDATKDKAFQIAEKFLEDNELPVASTDNTRPWGGFFCIDDAATQKFINLFFSDVPTSDVRISQKLSPKILLVEREKRLSWQYHHRRSEIWRVIGGTVQVVVSQTNVQTPPVLKRYNDIIVLKQGERHRLIGTQDWGIIAEIWQHTSSMPSDENDIVRVEDDFGR